ENRQRRSHDDAAHHCVGTIASMNWQSAEVLASLDTFNLTERYGCDAEIIFVN
ncbi:hypothetical protein NLY51_004967, partial [Salmonella enterica]|nr:hypothetical protein [Salmonella enterica]